MAPAMLFRWDDDDIMYEDILARTRAGTATPEEIAQLPGYMNEQLRNEGVLLCDEPQNTVAKAALTARPAGSASNDDDELPGGIVSCVSSKNATGSECMQLTEAMKAEPPVESSDSDSSDDGSKESEKEADCDLTPPSSPRTPNEEIKVVPPPVARANPFHNIEVPADFPPLCTGPTFRLFGDGSVPRCGNGLNWFLRQPKLQTEWDSLPINERGGSGLRYHTTISDGTSSQAGPHDSIVVPNPDDDSSFFIKLLNHRRGHQSVFNVLSDPKEPKPALPTRANPVKYQCLASSCKCLAPGCSCSTQGCGWEGATDQERFHHRVSCEKYNGGAKGTHNPRFRLTLALQGDRQELLKFMFDLADSDQEIQDDKDVLEETSVSFQHDCGSPHALDSEEPWKVFNVHSTSVDGTTAVKEPAANDDQATMTSPDHTSSPCVPTGSQQTPLTSTCSTDSCIETPTEPADEDLDVNTTLKAPASEPLRLLGTKDAMIYDVTEFTPCTASPSECFSQTSEGSDHLFSPAGKNGAKPKICSPRVHINKKHTVYPQHQPVINLESPRDCPITFGEFEARSDFASRWNCTKITLPDTGSCQDTKPLRCGALVDLDSPRECPIVFGGEDQDADTDTTYNQARAAINLELPRSVPIVFGEYRAPAGNSSSRENPRRASSPYALGPNDLASAVEVFQAAPIPIKATRADKPIVTHGRKPDTDENQTPSFQETSSSEPNRPVLSASKKQERNKRRHAKRKAAKKAKQASISN